MRKKPTRSVLFLILTTIVLLTLPVALSEKLRNTLSSTLSPLWSKFTYEDTGKLQELQTQVQKLEYQNNQLRNRPLQDKQIKNLFSAQVIFRSHAAWQSYLWVDIGSEDVPFSLKNAPVVRGDVIVGVIDDIKPRESRVRLLSDPALNPSVRVLRKGQYLAKGELNGRIKPQYRRTGLQLLGTGFNYDFPDKEGPARDLRDDIVQPGDILVTTGFDGVFPKGLKVAKVTKIYPLKEGDFYYDLEAESLAGSLNNLERLHVIPPIRRE